MASFHAGNFDFIVLSAHIRWGDNTEARRLELEMLADWIEAKRQERNGEDKDLMVMGDFPPVFERRQPSGALQTRWIRQVVRKRRRTVGLQDASRQPSAIRDLPSSCFHRAPPGCRAMSSSSRSSRCFNSALSASRRFNASVSFWFKP
jgi:hypothetical protein